MVGRRRWLLFAAGTLTAAGLVARSTVFSEPKPATGPPLDRVLPRSPDVQLISLKIEKSAHSLTVLYKGKPVKAYPVVLGRNPADDKLREGDGCTPEGTFRIKSLYPHKLWSRFLWLDYPTAHSWERFHAAQKAGRLPRNATIGGEIGIHGVPDRQDDLVDRRVNWTAGCISLKTSDILELYRYARVGTLVTIVH